VKATVTAFETVDDDGADAGADLAADRQIFQCHLQLNCSCVLDAYDWAIIFVRYADVGREERQRAFAAVVVDRISRLANAVDFRFGRCALEDTYRERAVEVVSVSVCGTSQRRRQF
jgi:hypothetical protein